MNLTIFDLPDEIIIKIFNARLSFHDIRNCALVCQKWYYLTSRGSHWKRWIVYSLKRKRINEYQYKILEKIAHHLSWKTAYLSKYALSTYRHPQFWNDVALFQFFQEHFTFLDQVKLQPLAQLGNAPCNGVLWSILQLQLTNTGIVSQVVLNKEAQQFLRSGLLVIGRHFGTKFLLEKLREIAAVPSRVFFMNEMVQVSSLLLLQAGFGNVCIEKVRPTWPTPASEFFDWNQHFVFPVQAAVIKALQIWLAITCARELIVTLGQKWLVRWLSDMGSECMWVDKTHYEASIKLCHSIWRKSKQSPPLHSTPPLPVSFGFLDKSAQVKQLATSLSALSYSQFHAIPESDLLNYLLCSSHQWSCGNIHWFELEFGEQLKEPIMSFCSAVGHSKAKKAALTQRVIAVCSHLKVLRDFRTLKTLVSAARAIAGQTSITGISWKDLNIKHCKMFKELEDLFDHKNNYSSYHRCIQQIKDKGLSFVPYLPAHRQQVKILAQQRGTRAGALPNIFTEVFLKETNEKKNEQGPLVEEATSSCDCEMPPSLSYLSRTFNSEELIAAKYVTTIFSK